ncbi:hypothetical protein EHW66_20540 [Erwinia psidii]|uniref:hypothetical protein n=1 Tax=Erwinia psidii TaxID=69224 RepID=UPI00226B75C5|nr:hypothetical protein [Erwinia psidii]MCX8967270.1 hypothetical protein [Erwinia psidii]
MHIITTGLRTALWLFRGVFRHAIFYPSALAGLLLAAWIAYGQPEDSLKALLHQQEAAWRGAPAGYYLSDACPPSARTTPARPAVCPLKPVTTDALAQGILLTLRDLWLALIILSTILQAVMTTVFRRFYIPPHAAVYIRNASGNIMKESGDE